MDDDFILGQANKQILSKRPAVVQPIGKDIYNWLGKYTRNTKKNTTILSLLQQIAGEEIMANCKPDSIRGGVLKIKVKPGPYMFQMRNMSGDILRRMQNALPSANISEIKLIAG
ncbi:MAG: hypothetical protein A2Y12_07885 [Planctomycetes bacterium GWF2_42_9]|nr:MAG: hypothetical protein A2Y12_07885 [Planctomycetes bacterium GWF2_42_9]HAL44657.1 hypothetical protein [Phycisphaerales bacterium]